MHWAAELAGQVRAKDIKKRLSSLRSYHVDMGFDIDVFRNQQLDQVVRGIKRLIPDPDRRERTPITREILVRLLNSLDPSTPKGRLLRAAFSLAFAGFLRSGELTYEAEDMRNPDFPSWNITRASIQFDPEGHFMLLLLPASKTDPFRLGVTITIARSPLDPLCAVRLMASYLQNTSPADPRTPLFIRAGGAPFTRVFLVQEVQRLALANGIAGNFTGHSFRRGAATWASRQGLGSDQVQKLGRWKSAAYQLYIDTTEQDKLALSRLFVGVGGIPAL